jgi:colicin import membrane protein
MARKLKTYVTSAGFFDLAVAAPSMKAALEAWGTRSDLFHQGFASVSDDPAIVAATMARPGLVLRRPVGTRDAFSEQAELPRNLPVGTARRPTTKPAAAKKEPRRQTADDATARKAAAAYEKEQKRRDRDRLKAEAAQQKKRRRRELAIAAAEAALADARRLHETRQAKVDKQRAALDRKAAMDDARWRKTQGRLEAALRRARSVSL